MKKLGIRLKKAREYLGLTQEHVANLLNISRVTISNIEIGTRKVSAEELSKFAKIYGWTMEELLEGKHINENLVFTNMFNQLSTSDQEEIINLMKFKRLYKQEKYKIN